MNYSPNFLQGGQKGGQKGAKNRKLSIAYGLSLIIGISFISLFLAGLPFTQADNDNMCEADVDAVMIMDRSGSMDYDSPTRLSQAKDAANSFLGYLGTNDQSALVSFSTYAFKNKALSDNHSATQSAVDGLIASGWTNIGDAIELANQELSSIRANSQAVKVAILITDGAANRPLEVGDPEIYAEAKAIEAAALGYKVFTIGLGSDINETMLKNIANITGAEYYFAPNGGFLEGIYNDISVRVCEYGSISGCKYNDSNNDGNISGENTIEDWEIVLSGGSNGPISQQTDQDGCYSFTSLLPGDYTVSEAGKIGVIFAQTYPSQGFYTINLIEGNDVDSQNFGNYIPYCGNSILDTGYSGYTDEICEIGDVRSCDATNNYAGSQECDQDCFGWGECIPQESCGDGIINDAEQCDGDDMGVYDPAHYFCTNDCIAEYIPYCGDNQVDQPEEECDQTESELCTTDNGYAGFKTCDSCLWSGCGTNEYCGDGEENGEEICDEGINNGIYGYCNQDCTGDTPSVCGNEVVEGDEECDHGQQGSDVCSQECVLIQKNPYCGDYEVNQEWEECDDGDDSDPEDGCHACQIDDECSDIVLARVNANAVSNATSQADMTSDIYLGSDSNIIPAGAWFLLYWQETYYTDSDISGYEDVPGLAVQRLEERVRAVMYGTLTSADIEHINGNIEFYNAAVEGQESDDSNDYPGNNQLENGFDGNKTVDPGQDEVWTEQGDNSHSYFWMTTNTADDGYYTDWQIIEDCKNKICGNKHNSYTQEGIEGWEITLKDKITGAFIATTTTDENGSYCFNQISPGDYRVEEELRDGWNYESYYYHNITYTGEELISVNFSNYQDSSITVCKYIDTDGLASTTEDQYLASTTVWTFILENNTATTSQETSGGCAVFNDLDSGEYVITEELAENWLVLDPESGEATTTLENGQSMTIDFINYYNEPIQPICGNAILEGNEECDLGGDNGLLCEAGYGKTCVYCSNACTIIELTGPYCGDGSCNSGETCSTCSGDCGSCGGGGGGGSTPLAVRNEQITCLSETSVIITWLTNKYSTSRVVYDIESQESMGSAPNYGYDFSTEEDADKVTNHSVIVENLAQNTVYYFKPISSASPNVLGKELAFNIADCCGEVVVLGEEGAPQLTVSKTVNADFANPGDENIGYKVVINNVGNLPAFDVILTDTLPDGFIHGNTSDLTQIWQIGNMEPGQIQEIEYLVNVSNSAVAGIYANTARLSASNHDSISASVDLEVRVVEVLAASGIDIAEYILLIILSIKLFVIAQIIRRKYLHPYNVFSVNL